MTLHNVTDLDLKGNWHRVTCDEGLIVVNPERVLSITINNSTKTL